MSIIRQPYRSMRWIIQLIFEKKNLILENRIVSRRDRHSSIFHLLLLVMSLNNLPSADSNIVYRNFTLSLPTGDYISAGETFSSMENLMLRSVCSLSSLRPTWSSLNSAHKLNNLNLLRKRVWVPCNFRFQTDRADIKYFLIPIYLNT